jgi:DNA-binding MarR family transcriptional regulator
MDRYTLTYEGRARFKRTKIRMDIEGKEEGYEALDYLYEHGAATVAEIEDAIGLSYEQVVSKLEDFLAWGYVERLAGR